MIGNFLGPEVAYRFARGETVRASGGVRARLVRPFDFLVVADHAENLGLSVLIGGSNPNLLRNPWDRNVYDLVKAGCFPLRRCPRFFRGRSGGTLVGDGNYARIPG
jgi:hypothetical protein